MDAAYPSTFNQVFGYILILDHDQRRQDAVRNYLSSRVTNYAIDTINDREGALRFFAKGAVAPNLVFASPELIGLVESYPWGGRINVTRDNGLLIVENSITGIRLKVVSSHIDLHDPHHDLVAQAVEGL